MGHKNKLSYQKHLLDHMDLATCRDLCKQIQSTIPTVLCSPYKYIDIVTMPSGFQVEYLILSIQEHPELWDISKNEYKENTKKQKLPGWLLVFGHILLHFLGGGPRVVVSTAAFHTRVRGSVTGLGGLKETEMT